MSHSERDNKGRINKKIKLDGLKLLEETCSKVDDSQLEDSGAVEAVTSFIMNFSRGNTDTSASGCDLGDDASDMMVAGSGHDDDFDVTAIKQKAHAVMKKMLKRTTEAE